MGAHRLCGNSLKQHNTASSVASCKVLTSVIKGNRRDDISCRSKKSSSALCASEVADCTQPMLWTKQHTGS